MADPHNKDIYKRPYNRPNEHWVCGLAAEGKPCPHGPSRRGHCHAGYECAPAQIGERWVCTRPEQYGGPCDSPALDDPDFGPHVQNGVGVCCKPVQCTPRRSIRALRGRTSVILSLALVGLILTALGGSWRNTFLSPGPLTVNHQGASMASLEDMEHGKLAESNASSESCHICHTTMEGGLTGLVTSAFKPTPSVSQSSQCLTCHQEDVGSDAMLTHALPGETLAEITAQAEKDDFSAQKPLSLALAAYSPGVKMSERGELACAACHREHNGAFFDLKKLDNQSCQTCHVKQFNSIAHGHPDFSKLTASGGYDYPYQRRTRIIFDHERHETNYFTKEENLAHVPEDCTSCHEITGDSFTTRLKPFEEMCASCHTSNIVSSRDEWIHVLGYPSLEFDVYEILEEELELPPVPRTAEKSLSPFMMLLLSGYNKQNPDNSAAFTEDFAMVQEFEGDLSGIAYDEDPEIVGRLYEGMGHLRGLAADEEQGGLRRVLTEQLERLSGAPVEPAQLDAMFGFPKLGSSLEKVIEDVSRKDIIEMSGWHVEESGFRLDPASWKATLGDREEYKALEESIGDGDGGPYADVIELFGNYSAFREWFDERFRVEGEDWISIETGKEVKNKDWKDLVTAMVGGGAKEAPEEAAEEETAGGDSDEADSEDAEEEEDAADTAPASNEVDGALKDAGDAFVAWVGSKSKFQRWLEDTADISGENWTLRAPRSLYYRPIQHADPFTVAWLDYTASLYAKNPAAAMLFDTLSGRATGSAIGSCMKCHSIDAERDSAGDPVIKVNWKSTRPERGFTKFKHTPHLKLMNCAECHRAPWVPAVRERMNLARAASAEEEEVATEAAAPAEEVSAETPAPAEEASANPAATEETEAPDGDADALPSRPEITYLDGYKASPDSPELGVSFSAMGHGEDAHLFVSNFEPMAKSDCARCHVADKAGDSCLICHNYHIKGRNPSFGAHSLRELILKAEGGAGGQAQ